MSYINNLEEIKWLFKRLKPNHVQIEIHKPDDDIVDYLNITGNTIVNFTDDMSQNGFTNLSFAQRRSINFEIRVEGIEIIDYNEKTKDKTFEFLFFMPNDQFARITVKGVPNDDLIDFDKFVRLAKDCTACESMLDKEAIIGNSNGNVDTDIIFVAEAPGPRGADKTGIPLTGDVTGKNFEEIINSVGLKRGDIFITNAVLCCPTDSKGKVRSPKNDEIKNCNVFLDTLINLIDPKVVVPIGQVALKALNYIEKHQLTLKGNVATFHDWNGRYIFPLYHPSPLVINTGLRTMGQQKEDYQKLVRIYRNRILSGLNPIR